MLRRTDSRVGRLSVCIISGLAASNATRRGLLLRSVAELLSSGGGGGSGRGVAMSPPCTGSKMGSAGGGVGGLSVGERRCEISIHN